MEQNELIEQMETDRNKEYTPRQKKVLELLFTEAGGNLRHAMNLAGYNKRQPLHTILDPLKEDILELTKNYLAFHAPQAGISIIDVMINPAKPGASNQIKAAESLLDRVGILKSQEVKNTTEIKNVFILPEKREEQKVIDLDETEYEEISGPDDGGDSAED